jgi:hypothetical protein
MLFLKKCYFDAVRRGEKTTTLRYWPRRMVRPGSVHGVRGLGRVRIDEVRIIQVEDLTDDIARADGLADRGEVIRTLNDYYPPDVRAGRDLYLVRFALLDEE